MVRSRMLARTLAVCACAAALVLSACSGGGTTTYQFTTSTKLDTVIPAAQRKPAQSITGQLLDGQGSLSLHQYRGKVVVLNFWASWCEPCRSETPQLVGMSQRLRGDGVQFVGIDTKDTRAGAKAVVSSDHIRYPIVYDQEGQVQLRLGNIPGSLPFTVLIDKQGRVAAVYLSALTAKDLQRPLARLRAEAGSHAD